MYLNLLAAIGIGILAYGTWELRAIRKVHQARWDYERARLIINREDCLSEAETDAVFMDALSHPYELRYKVRKLNAEEPLEAVCQCDR